MPRTGFEPARLAALPPQGSASANFATWATLGPDVTNRSPPVERAALPPIGIEPTTCPLGKGCSIQLSYRGGSTASYSRRPGRFNPGDAVAPPRGFGCNAAPHADDGRTRRRAPPARLPAGRAVLAAAVRLRRLRRPAADHARGPAAGDKPGDARPPRPAPADQRRPAVAGAAAAPALGGHVGHGRHRPRRPGLGRPPAVGRHGHGGGPLRGLDRRPRVRPCRRRARRARAGDQPRVLPVRDRGRG